MVPRTACCCVTHGFCDLLAGSFAERIRVSALCLYVVLFTIIVYCPIAHMTWHPDGLLRKAGVLDFAGGTVVHLSSGVAALAATVAIGPRKNHGVDDDEAKVNKQPANVPFVFLGTAMLWFGWFGFNAGSAISAGPIATAAFFTTNTASATAMLSWILLDYIKQGKGSCIGACTGAVIGLVAITPAAGFVSVGSSIFIGWFSALISYLYMEMRLGKRVDDTLEVFGWSVLVPSLSPCRCRRRCALVA